MCEHVKIYDNSRSFTKIASVVQGKYVDRSEFVPKWCKSIIDKNM